MRILLAIFTLIYSYGYGQYSPLQSHYLFNGIALNPALTGSEQTLSVAGSFRYQWSGFPGAPKTETLSIHAPIKDKNSSFGIQLFADQIGVDRNVGVYGLYAYKFKINQSSKLSLGISGGVNMLRSLNEKLNLESQTDPSFAVDSPLGVLPNFSLGAHYYSNKYFISLSIPMFLSHDFDGGKYRTINEFNNYNILLGGGYEFELRNSIVLKPSVLMKYKPNNRLQADINLKLKLIDYLDVGVSYRTEEAIILFFEAKANRQFSLMYSFGLPISTLTKYSFGSHEISLKYNFLYKTNSASPRHLGW